MSQSKVDSNGRYSPSIEKVMRGISDLKRLEVLACLALGEACVSNVADRLGYDHSDICRQLQTLRKLGLVTCHRVKREQRQRLAKSVEVNIVRDSLTVSVVHGDDSCLRMERPLERDVQRRLGLNGIE